MSKQESPETFRSRNRLALVCLVLGKILGVLGLVLGATRYRSVGAVFLGLDGVLLVTAVVLSLRNTRGMEKEESSHKQILAQMMREGTLQQYLRDLEAEKRAGSKKKPEPVEEDPGADASSSSSNQASASANLA